MTPFSSFLFSYEHRLKCTISYYVSVPMYLSIDLFIYLSIYLPFYASIYLSIYLSNYVSNNQTMLHSHIITSNAYQSYYKAEFFLSC